MKKYHIVLSGENKFTPGASLAHGITGEYELTEENRGALLATWIAEVQESNPDFTHIQVNTVEEYLEGGTDDTEEKTRIVFQTGTWAAE